MLTVGRALVTNERSHEHDMAHIVNEQPKKASLLDLELAPRLFDLPRLKLLHFCCVESNLPSTARP